MGRKPKDEFELSAKAPAGDYSDYFFSNPDVPATDLLARVYDALVRRGFRFYFSYFIGDALFTKGLKESIRVHFFLPDLNLAIIIKGGYWFDKGSNLNDTAMDLAMLQYAGINTIFWTEDELMSKGLDQMFAEQPLLNVPHAGGGPIDTDYPPLDYKGMTYFPPRPFRKQRQVKYNVSKRREKL